MSKHLERLLARLDKLREAIDRLIKNWHHLSEDERLKILTDEIRHHAAHLETLTDGWHKMSEEMAITELKMIIHNFIARTWRRWFKTK